MANACLSSQLSQQVASADGHAEGAASQSRGNPALVATLADEFFKRGVSDYIGAAWEIPSKPAKVFAEEFYKALLAPGGRIGPAVCKARAGRYKRRQDLGAAWAAYQHYGDPTRSVLVSVVQPENR